MSVGPRALQAARAARHRARRATRRAKERLAQGVLEQRVFVRLMPALVRHVHGPTEIRYGPEESIDAATRNAFTALARRETHRLPRQRVDGCDGRAAHEL